MSRLLVEKLAAGGANRLADRDHSRGRPRAAAPAGCPTYCLLRASKPVSTPTTPPEVGSDAAVQAIRVITEDSRPTASKCSFGVPIYAGHGRTRTSTGSATLSSITDV